MPIGRSRFQLWGMCTWCTWMALSIAGCEPPQPGESETSVEEPSSEPLPRTELSDGSHRLERHMQYMATVPPDSLPHVMPMHLEEVGVMLDEMEPMSLGMQSDTVWRSTLDSVQNDLARVRDMDTEELGEFMPEHSRRIERLISLHDSAMGAER
jgi:hypothetical protein